MNSKITLFILLILASCKGNPDNNRMSQNSVYISGSISEGANRELIFQEILSGGKIPLDTVIITRDNRFSITYPINKTNFYSLSNEKGNSITLICHPGDSIRVESSYFNFSIFELSGNQEMEQLSILNIKTQNFLNEIAGYAKIISDSMESPDYADIRIETDRKYRAAFDSLKIFSTRFIHKNQGSLVTLLALSNQLGENFFVFHPVKDFEIFEETASSLSKNYSGLEPVINLLRQVDKIRNSLPDSTAKNLEKGDLVPDIVLNNPQGVPVSLSSMKGKIVLISFWASWCKECREINRELKYIYKKYKNKGFEIYQVSLDNSAEKWKKAIDEDKLEWKNGSDLKFWESKAVEDFFITNIPYNYLIDEKGKIISVNLGVAQLEIELEKLIVK